MVMYSFDVKGSNGKVKKGRTSIINLQLKTNNCFHMAFLAKS